MGAFLPPASRDISTSGNAYSAARFRVRGRSLMVAAGTSVVVLYAMLQLIVGPHVTGVQPTAGLAVLVLMPQLLTAGVLTVLLARRSGAPRASELAGNALLVTLVGVVALTQTLAGSGANGSMAAAEPAAALRVVAVLPPLLATLVVLRRGSRPTPRVTLRLLTGTLLLSTQALVALHGYAAAAAWYGSVSAAAGVAGVALVVMAVAGMMGVSAAEPSAVSANGAGSGGGALTGSRGRSTATLIIVPGSAVFMALALVDLGFRPAVDGTAAWALALLAGALAVRTTQLVGTPYPGADQQRQLEHTRALVEVTHALAGTTDLDETLRVISESARAVLRAGAAGIELVSEDGGHLESRAVVGMSREILGLQFPVSGSFTGWVVRHGEPRATADPSRDPYIQPESLAYLGRSPIAAAPIRFRDETLGVLFACNRDEPFDADELRLLSALAEQAAIGIDNARLFEQVTILSVTDPLTGLANRRQLERELEREFAAARRGRDLVAVIFDLDEFKAYNDAHGHLAGDEALQAFASALLEETRAMNFAARYGGDEFVALLAGTEVDGARAFVERLRARFSETSGSLGRGGVSFSAGVAAFRPEMSGPEELLRRADDDLYRAKSRVEA